MGIYHSSIHVGKKIISIVVGHMRFFFLLFTRTAMGRGGERVR